MIRWLLKFHGVFKGDNMRLDLFIDRNRPVEENEKRFE
jgi:hypothetical protein